MASSTTCDHDLSPLLLEIEQSSLSQRLALPGDEAFNSSLTSYFSQQEQNLQPVGVLLPESAGDVAAIVKTASKYFNSVVGESPYLAIRSGGKAPSAGTANIQAGIVIDLSKLNQVTPATDRKTVKIGPGALWGDVYRALDAKGMGVAGGRDATVGVGGLTLGGGMSWFGPQRGFVCDDVTSFEVVLASFEVVQASRDSHPDLWRVLKGGSNNFGIVTGFTFRSFELGNIWGGQNVYSIDTAPKHLDALHDFTANTSPDPYATVIQSFALYQGNVIINEGLKYTKPEDNPPIFEKFLAIQPVMYSSNKIMNMTAAAMEQSGFNQNGRRQALLTTTFINDRDMLQYAFNAWQESIPSIETIADVQWSLTFQPLVPAITQKAQESGGNVLGLDDASHLILAEIAITWDAVEHDDVLIDKALEIINNIEKTAKSRGKFHRYKSLNYAWLTQKPIDSYGPANKEFMRGVSKKYDPTGFFQNRVAGGFKLFT